MELFEDHSDTSRLLWTAPTPGLHKRVGTLELVIWENIAYLANDQRRASAFAALKTRVGVEPKAILEADPRTLTDIAKAGILADLSAEKLLKVAKIAYEQFNSDLRPTLNVPLLQAKKALKKFPGIGDPGCRLSELMKFCLSS